MKCQLRRGCSRVYLRQWGHGAPRRTTTPTPLSPPSQPPLAVAFRGARHLRFLRAACVCALRTRARPLARPATAAAAASLPSPLARDAKRSSRPVCLPDAGVGVVYAAATARRAHCCWPALCLPERAATAAARAQRRPARAAPAAAGRVACVTRARHLRRPAGPPAGRFTPHRLAGRVGVISQRAGD